MGRTGQFIVCQKLLTDIQTRRTRQSMTDDEAQMVAGGVRLARKISTQAVLGGFTQPLRQVPDQLAKLFFTTGRFDLITKNLLKIAETALLLNTSFRLVAVETHRLEHNTPLSLVSLLAKWKPL
jgi:hypothetical protein